MCAVQTVPSCPVLYKHTFKYHTVSCLPPDYEECFAFLGAPRAERLHACIA